MKKILSLVVMAMFFLFLFASVLQADEYRWTGDRYINYAYPTSNGFAVTLLGDRIVTETTCHNRFFISLDSPNYDALVATILTARMLEQPINICYNYTGAVGQCSAPIDRLIF